ncbi:MAG: UDP-N-acetylglucosamine 2-epimerase (non-hydrolyzing) [Planctomycetes bacterium]|nr:UDP-N-acetylglucosamine 2-epimerase (non-hydrolyzing) [Planctomycetota bacterium]
MRIVNICGARPNFMKIAPLMEAYRARPEIEPLLVHTGQHYDKVMSELFFDELGIPRPDLNLEVGSGTHAVQTAEIMKRFEPVVVEHKPDLVLVVGDVNSTVACALVARKLGVPVAHVEAGLRSGDEAMPEEINRRLTDAISNLCFVTEESGIYNLGREGVPQDRVHFVGNVMIDTLLKHLERARQSAVLANLGLVPQGYAVMTLHRPSNVDDAAVLSRLLDAIDVVQRDMPIIFPCHPRTRGRIEAMGLGGRLASMGNLRLIDPQGYLDFLCLTASANLVLTDSGGIQEETTILRVPCLTLRENTERPVTCTLGSNQLVGTDPARILAAYRRVQDGQVRCDVPPLWDGRAAERIVQRLVS